MAQVKVDYAWSVAIRVRYLGPTNTLGSRWRVWRADEIAADDPDAMTVPYDHALNGSDGACAAVAQYLEAKESESWAGRWVLAGANDREYIAVKAAAPMGEED